MTIEDDIAFLERVPILRRLGAPALAHPRHRRRKPRRRARAGPVHLPATPPTAPMSCSTARSACSRPRAKRSEVIAGPGTLLGESALLAETRGRPPRRRARRRPCCAFRARCSGKCSRAIPEAAHRLRELIAARTDQWAREMENVRARARRARRRSRRLKRANSKPRASPSPARGRTAARRRDSPWRP